MNPLFPFAPHYLTLGPHQLHYLDEGLAEGAGESLVLVHGNPTWSFYFRHLVTELRGQARVIVPDHLGCGLSSKPTAQTYPFTLQQRAQDLETLLDHLKINRDITLILHDWGGMIGMTYAHWHPERIKRIVLLNTAAFRLPASKAMPWQLRLCRTPLLGSLLVQGFNAFCRGTVKQCSVKPLAPEVQQAYLQPYDTWAHRLAVLRFVQDIPLRPADSSYALVEEVEQGLSRFQQTPMLIAWGEQDFVFDRHFLQGWRDRFPQAQVHTFPDAGHLILEDKPTEVAGLVKDFLRATR